MPAENALVSEGENIVELCGDFSQAVDAVMMLGRALWNASLESEATGIAATQAARNAL